MKIITHEKIVGAGTLPSDWYTWAEHVLKHKYEYQMPAKTSIHFNETSYFNTMPSIIPELDAMGVKVVNRYMGRTPSLESQLLLYCYSDGSLKAILDASYITAMRTGAVAAHTVQEFARHDFSTIGIMGFGNIGIAVLEVLLDHFADRSLTVTLLRHRDQSEGIIRRFSRYDNVTFREADEVEQIIRNQDVIISCITFADTLLGRDEWFGPGCLVVPVHLRGFQNCDLFFDRVIADDEGQVSGFRYFDRFKNFAETSEVLNGIKPGRQDDKERIISYSVGMSLHDIYAAAKLEALINDIPDLPLQLGPTERFWL